MTRSVRLVLVGALGITVAAVAFAIETYERKPFLREWSTTVPAAGGPLNVHLSMEISGGRVAAIWLSAAAIWLIGSVGLLLPRRSPDSNGTTAEQSRGIEDEPDEARERDRLAKG